MVKHLGRVGKISNSYRQHVHLSKKGQKKVKKVMDEFSHGTLHSGSKHGPVVHSRKQVFILLEKRN